jgi:hypothetical protein
MVRRRGFLVQFLYQTLSAVVSPAFAMMSRLAPGLFRVSLGARHFWQVGHQNVERPFWVNRFTTPLQPAVWHFSPSRS